MKIHDLSAQHIFPSQRYTTYECMQELVVSSVVWSKAAAGNKFYAFCCWEKATGGNLLICGSDPSSFSMTFQAWKMVFLIPWLSMTRGHPVYHFLSSISVHDMHSAILFYHFHLSVRLSNAGIAKRLHALSHFFWHSGMASVQFLELHRRYRIPRGTPSAGALFTRQWGVFCDFRLIDRRLYGNGTRADRSVLVATTWSDLERRDAMSLDFFSCGSP